MHSVDSPNGSLDPTRAEPTPGADYPATDVPTRELAQTYRDLVESPEVTWSVTYRLLRKLGSGGQGDVFLADRRGSFDATFRLAIKFFRTTGYATAADYHDEMRRLAKVSMALSHIQQDHVVDVYNVVDFQHVHALAMEWINGFDLRCLLTPSTLDRFAARVDRKRLDYVNDVIVTRTPSQLRLKPGVAIAILRECLAGLAALHRRGIVHADIKPANVMVKRTGNCKLIDFGSAFLTGEGDHRATWTPRYAAVEVLEGDVHTPASDLASLGYVLFEALSGTYPFATADSVSELIAAKRDLARHLERDLPPDVASNTTLVNLLRGLISPDPSQRFTTAEQADLHMNGAAEIHRQLIRSNLASEYENEIRLWLEELE
jgi:serine/threonine protein kinase